MRKLILLYILILVAAVVRAQSISVSAPSHVAVGENFRIAYTVSTQSVENFRAGNIPSALEVIAGPYTSSQSSFQMVFDHLYLYTLCGKEWNLYNPCGSRNGQRTRDYFAGSENHGVGNISFGWK